MPNEINILLNKRSIRNIYFDHVDILHIHVRDSVVFI